MDAEHTTALMHRRCLSSLGKFGSTGPGRPLIFVGGLAACKKPHAMLVGVPRREAEPHRIACYKDVTLKIVRACRHG